MKRKWNRINVQHDATPKTTQKTVMLIGHQDCVLSHRSTIFFQVKKQLKTNSWANDEIISASDKIEPQFGNRYGKF